MVFPKWEVNESGVKVKTTESLSQTICGLCTFGKLNPVAMNMPNSKTPAISKFPNSASDFIYLYLIDL